MDAREELITLLTERFAMSHDDWDINDYTEAKRVVELIETIARNAVKDAVTSPPG